MSINVKVISLRNILTVVAGIGFAAAPVSANSAADSFRINTPHSGNEIGVLGEADGTFRSLHTDWGKKASQSVSARSTTAVSIPDLYPLDMNRVRMSSGFGARSAPVAGASRNHKGIDLAAPLGTPIYATADGIVARAGWASGYGKVVYIDHGNGIETRYGHMSGMDTFAGEVVRKGDVIGYVGSTGRSSGNHLHYEVRIDGVAMNPSSFMNTDPNDTKMQLASQ